MTALAVPELEPMTSEDARALTVEIRYHQDEAYELLFKAHERRAWAVLGYSSFKQYVATEFHISRSRAYQLVHQGKVVQAISAAVSTKVDIPEVATRELDDESLSELIASIKLRLAVLPDDVDHQQIVNQMVNQARDQHRCEREQAEELQRQFDERRALMERNRRALDKADPQFESTLEIRERLMRETVVVPGEGRRVYVRETPVRLGTDLQSVEVDTVTSPSPRSFAAERLSEAHEAYWGTIEQLIQLDLDRVMDLLSEEEKDTYSIKAETLRSWLDGYMKRLGLL